MALSLSVNCKKLKNMFYQQIEGTSASGLTGMLRLAHFRNFFYLVKHGQAGSTAIAPSPPLLAQSP